MDGPLYLHGPFRPIPMYQRPTLLDTLSCRVPAAMLRDPASTWKPTEHDSALAKPVPTLALPYSLSLLDHVRRQQANLNPFINNLPKTPLTTVSLTQLPSQERPLVLTSNPEILNSRPAPRAQEKSPRVDPIGNLVRPLSDPYSSQYGYGRKVFPCSQCRYTTDRRNNLKRHMLTMHQASSKLLECCGILFTTKASLREHAMIFHYHGYTCFYCGRRFCRKALLKRHLSVHNGQKDFVCSVCDYATSHKSNLERHRKVHLRQDDGEDQSSSPLYEENKSSDANMADSSDELSICSEDEEINVHID
ncbi:zinc finger protein 585B [Patella vulgata]|uniref:zinc finger protein 585B n=1 Tax=Patella vulgata TaxID=6465 RepID=UPI00217F516B|nr:zinc finger protein 585B [Patella vulgata]